jgi:hypothetical protein
MNTNKSPLKNQTKRLYHQYLGFINSLNFFNKNTININYFNFQKQDISYEKFQSFSLNVKVPLGKRVEHFFEFYIEQHPDYRMVKKNIQVNHNKTTIGEFDFFLEELETGKIIHVELVYKFYIYFENEDEIKRYHGPNKHDNLEDKLNKLKNKQFPLLRNPRAKEILNDLDISKVTQQLCFLGNTFLHPNSKAKFDLINPNTVTGSYITFTTFLNEASYKTQTYFIPQKEDWLIEPKYGEFWYDFEETLEEIEKNFERSNSLLLWMKNEDYFERVFILNYNLPS